MIDFKADWQWLLHHLILVTVVVVLAVGGVYAVESIIAKHDAAMLSKQELLLKQAHADTQLALKQLSDFEVASAQRDAANTALINRLSQQRQTRDTQNQQQVKTDQNLNAVDAAARLVRQVNAGPHEVVVQNDLVVMDLPVTRTIVSDLDTLTATQADLKDADAQIAAQTQKTTDAQQRYLDAKAALDSQTKEAGQQAIVCKDTITVLKAKQRKRDIIIGIIGAIFGFGARVATHG